MAYVKEEALQKREPLVQGAELNIDGKGGKFLIRELIGAGGTSLVYDAVLVRADGSRVTGVLKEFYPQVTAGTSYNFSMLLRYMTVRRKPNGTLAIPAELRDGQRKRLEEVDSLLHEIKSEGLGLRRCTALCRRGHAAGHQAGKYPDGLSEHPQRPTQRCISGHSKSV